MSVFGSQTEQISLCGIGMWLLWNSFEFLLSLGKNVFMMLRITSLCFVFCFAVLDDEDKFKLPLGSSSWHTNTYFLNFIKCSSSQPILNLQYIKLQRDFWIIQQLFWTHVGTDHAVFFVVECVLLDLYSSEGWEAHYKHILKMFPERWSSGEVSPWYNFV